MFFLLYRHTNNGVIDDFPKISDHFPKISDHFPKISEDSPQFVRRSHERCWTFLWNVPKIAEDIRGRPEDILIVHQGI